MVFVPSYVGCMWITAMTEVGLVNKLTGDSLQKERNQDIKLLCCICVTMVGDYQMLHVIQNPSSDQRTGKEHVFGILIFQKKGGPSTPQKQKSTTQLTRQSTSGIRKQITSGKKCQCCIMTGVLLIV